VTPPTPAPIVIACGDPNGVGPEVSLKAVAAELSSPESPDFVLVGDHATLEQTRATLGLTASLPWHPFPIAKDRAPNQTPRVAVLHVPPRNPPPTPANPAQSPAASLGALAAVDSLHRAAQGCLNSEFSALVTAPVSKERIINTGIPFIGQTEFLAQQARCPEITMMLLGDDDLGRWLRVALVTTHLPLRHVAAAITAAAVSRAIRHAALACHQLRLPRARIGIAGLNPHAGEGGHLGNEEISVITPAIREAQHQGIDAHGPLSGDTIFHHALHGGFDAVVAMYHDQGLAPLKVAAFERGVNWSLGLPFIRTSPDHGTAFDIAGRGIADPSSMRAAIRLAIRLATPHP